MMFDHVRASRSTVLTALAFMMVAAAAPSSLHAQTVRDRFPKDTSKPARLQKPRMNTPDTVFTARGIDPAWTLLVRSDSLFLNRPTSGSSLRFPSVRPDTASGVVSWHLNGGGHALLITARLGRCVPRRPDDAWSHLVTIQIDGKSLKGCGGRRTGSS